MTPPAEHRSALMREVKRLRRRAALGAWIARLGAHLPLALVAAGAAVLLARASLDLERARAAWLLAPVLLAPATAWLRARRARLSQEGAATWLDLRTGSTGLVLTQAELGDARWQERAEGLLPRPDGLPRLRPAGAILRALPAASFALLALWIEIPERRPAPAARLFQSATERLREKLETLEEEIELQESEALELEARLARIEEEIEAARAESAFEALDRLEERLEERAEEARGPLEEARGSLDRLARGSIGDPEAAQLELERTLARLREEGLDRGLDRDLPAGLFPEPDAAAVKLPDGIRLPGIAAELAGRLDARLASLGRAGLLGRRPRLAPDSELARLADYPEPHVCDERCEKKPGGT